MLASVLSFVGVSLVVICTPGPDTALTVRNALAGGRRCGLATAAGVASGQLVWTIAAGAGLAGLLLASEPAFRAVKLVGAAYLVVLGAAALWSAVRGHPEASATHPRPRIGPVRALRQGAVSNLANPKMAAFFLSLLPQFVAPGPGSASGFLLLGTGFCLMTFGWLAGYALLVDRARRLLLRDRVRRIIEAVSGAVLVAFGLRLASTR